MKKEKLVLLTSVLLASGCATKPESLPPPSVAPARDTAAVARGEAATRAAMVLSDLLERSVATNRELAQAYDRARIAGEQCAREHDALVASERQ